MLADKMREVSGQVKNSEEVTRLVDAIYQDVLTDINYSAQRGKNITEYSTHVIHGAVADKLKLKKTIYEFYHLPIDKGALYKLVAEKLVMDGFSVLFKCGMNSNYLEISWE